MSSRLKVGIDLSPIGFRERAPGTAVLVENQARRLLALETEWDWIPVATPSVLRDSPFFRSFDPIVVGDAPLSYHATVRLGRIWAEAGCALGFATAFFAPLSGPPVVTNYFDANAFYSDQDIRTLRDRLKSAVVQGLWKLSRRRSRALFILSEYGRARMIEADPATASKWVVAPCGVLSPAAGPMAPPEWARLLHDRPFILYAGAFSENKNQRRLIEAWDVVRRRHPAFPVLLLIGPSPADYLREVIYPVRARTSHPEGVVLPGFVSKTDLAWAFQEAHAYIQPSFAEGFGLPVVEAMNYGLPVACSKSTSLPEVAGNAAVLFDPSSVDSIAQALEMIALDEPIRARLKSAGLTQAKKFTWERNAAIVAQRIREELRAISTS